MPKVTIEMLPNIEAINNLFVKLEKDTNWDLLWKDVADEWYDYTHDIFATEGKESGQKWQPLSPKYKAWKEMRYPGQPILTLTGKMKAGFTNRRSGYAKYVESRNPPFLIMGISDKIPYAQAHQFGMPDRGLPARPIVRFSREITTDIVNVFRSHMVQKRLGRASVAWKRARGGV